MLKDKNKFLKLQDDTFSSNDVGQNYDVTYCKRIMYDILQKNIKDILDRDTVNNKFIVNMEKKSTEFGGKINELKDIINKSSCYLSRRLTIEEDGTLKDKVG